MKTEELTGHLLDFWVAKALEQNAALLWDEPSGGKSVYLNPLATVTFKPSTSWEQGGPIIEMEVIKLQPVLPRGATWHAIMTEGLPEPAPDGSIDMNGMKVWRGKGETPLVAAMRCLVAKKFGDEVPA